MSETEAAAIERLRPDFEKWAQGQQVFKENPSHMDLFKREDTMPDRFYYFWGITEAAWQAYQAGISQERERCAKIAEKMETPPMSHQTMCIGMATGAAPGIAVPAWQKSEPVTITIGGTPIADAIRNPDPTEAQ